LFLFAASLCGFVSSYPLSAKAPVRTDQWVAAWATSNLGPSIFRLPNDSGFANQTIRIAIPLNTGGQAIRLRLANRFSRHLVTFDAVTVAIQREGAASANLLPVRFGGKASVTVAVGADALSDPVLLPVKQGQHVMVSLFTQGETGIPTRGDSGAISYIAPGNAAAEESGASFTPVPATFPPMGSGSYFVSAVDVLASRPGSETIVVIGDSLTAGGLESWPGMAVARLAQDKRTAHLSLVNVAVGGNRLLTGSVCSPVFGFSGLDRLNEEVLMQSGATTVIAMWINDVQLSFTDVSVWRAALAAGIVLPYECFGTATSTADDMIAGYRQMIAQAHARGIKVVLGTITPFAGASFWTEEKEKTRQIINDWVLHSGEPDGAIDFAKALADPGNHLRFDPRFDSGDHLHENDAGKAAMADAAAAFFRIGNRND